MTLSEAVLKTTACLSYMFVCTMTHERVVTRRVESTKLLFGGPG